MMPLDYDVDVEGDDTAAKKLAATSKELSKTSRDDLRWAIKAAQRARQLAPRGKTGKLKGSIKVDHQNISIKAGGEQAPHAVYQEFGFAPHTVPIEYLKTGRRTSVPNPQGFTTVTENTPFFRPAMKQVLGAPSRPKKYIKNKRNWISRILKSIW